MPQLRRGKPATRHPTRVREDILEEPRSSTSLAWWHAVIVPGDLADQSHDNKHIP